MIKHKIQIVLCSTLLLILTSLIITSCTTINNSNQNKKNREVRKEWITTNDISPDIKGFTPLGLEFEYADEPIYLNGKVVYTANKDGDYFVVSGNDIVSGKYKELNKKVIGGKLAYTVLDEDNKFKIIYDGKTFGEEYNLTRHPRFGDISQNIIPIEVNNTLAYFIPRLRILVYDGKQINGSLYPNRLPVEVNSSLAFELIKDNFFETRTIMYNGKEYGTQYKDAFQPTEINGKLAYIASNNETVFRGKTFIVYDGKEIGKQYGSVSSPEEVNEKLVYTAYSTPETGTGTNDCGFLVYEGREYGKIGSTDKQNCAFKPFILNGKFCYVYARRLSESKYNYTLVCNEKEIGHLGEEINGNGYLIINKKLVYSQRIVIPNNGLITGDNNDALVNEYGGKEYRIIYDGKEVVRISYPYLLNNIWDVDGKLAIGIIKYYVSERNQSVGSKIVTLYGTKTKSIILLEE